MIDPGSTRDCQTAENEYSKGFDAGLADGFDNLSPETKLDNDWYNDGYNDGYQEMNSD